ncbi:MAG: LysE family transporter [Betaproteobacteria bacterium]|nr:LysE family transporter [Betaproteobacteria bacterium]
MSLATWFTFLLAVILLCFSPGPGALSSMSAGMKYGWRRGMWNCLGMQASIIVNSTIIALGLGAILMASSTAFEVMKWCGALYLVWLGIQKFREPPVPFEEVAARTEFNDTTTRGIFLQGFLVSQTNPKGLLFLLAVLPQFIDPAHPTAMQYVILTATLVVVDIIAMGCYTAFAAKVLTMLKDPGHIRWTNRGIGSLFVVAGGMLAGFRRG